MTLLEWARLREPALFDVGVYTVARTLNLRRHTFNGFVVFSSPSPYQVYYARTLLDLERMFGRPLGDVVGQVFFDGGLNPVSPAPPGVRFGPLVSQA